MAKHRKITEHNVRVLQPKAERYQINEHNLQIEVNPTGRKVWFCYGWQDGKKFKKKLGSYPEMSAKAAREKVTETLHERNQGLRVADDPSSLTAFVEGPFREWCLSHRKQGDATMKRLRHTHLPHLGNRKMRDINPQDIERRKVRLLQNKQPATVKRDLGDLRRVFSKAVEWGYLRRSPASTVSDPKVEHREKLYLSENELRRLHESLCKWDELCRNEGNGQSRYRLHPAFPVFIRVLANTGMRKSEGLNLEFRDIHVGKGTPDATPTRSP